MYRHLIGLACVLVALTLPPSAAQAAFPGAKRSDRHDEHRPDLLHRHPHDGHGRQGVASKRKRRTQQPRSADAIHPTLLHDGDVQWR
jgi:hypothetical protein